MRFMPRRKARWLGEAIVATLIVGLAATPQVASASGNVTYDATGGGRCANCATLSWSHTVSGTNTAMLVGVGVGAFNDGNCSASVTYNGVALTSEAKVHAFNSTDGFEQVFGMSGPPTGTHTVAVTVSGCSPDELTGESESFDNAAPTSTFSGTATVAGDGPSPSITTSGSTSSDMYAGFIAHGHSITGINFGTSRLVENQDNTTGAGNSAAATTPSTGSGVEIGWSASASDYWGIVAVQVDQFTGGGQMSPPPGFSTKIFDDQFTGTTLDTSKWVTFLGAEGIRWDDKGLLPSPYSGPNTPGNANMAMFGPSQVTVNNGLSLTAQRNTNKFSTTFPWISGVVTTEGKLSMPTDSSWYVQVKAKMPDTSQGMFPAIWFQPGVSGTAVNELDGYEGGFAASQPNFTMHSDFFADQGQQQSAYNVGTDLTTAYHVYGIQFIPGQSITVFLDGRQVWQVLASSGITIKAEPYEILINLQVAADQDSSWHTITNANTPTSTMSVAEVQAYKP
jgi:Glycosyl hydrolases family 16